MGRPESSETTPPLHASDAEAVQELLARNPVWYRLPPGLERGFAEQRRREFLTIAITGGPLVYLLFGVIAAIVMLQFPDQAFHGWNARVFWSCLAFNTVSITIGIILSRIPFIQVRYLWLVLCNGSLQLAAALAATLLVTDPAVQRGMSYVVIYFVSFVVVALRAPVSISVLTGLAGLIEAVIVAGHFGVQPDWGQLLDYYGGAIFVAGAIALAMERLERLSYLRSVLLAHESAEKSRLFALLEQESQEIRRLNGVLGTLAAQDQLSGLANRRRFDEVLLAEWERARRQQVPLALLFIDVDYFKRYNDSYGHGAGDECLVRVAGVLRDCCLRPADLAARYGGEEFVILLPETGLPGAREVAERVLAGIDALAMPHAGSDAASHVTVSIGLAVQEAGDGGSTMQLLQRADAALYEAKAGGRHCCREAERA